MAPTTYAAFSAALAGLTVSGVTRKFTEPPASVTTADLPALWPRALTGNEPMMTFGNPGGWPVLTGELVIALEPFGQNTQGANYAAVVAMLDNLTSTLRSNFIGRGPNIFSLREDIVQVADAAYWAVIATIEIR